MQGEGGMVGLHYACATEKKKAGVLVSLSKKCANVTRRTGTFIWPVTISA